MSRIPLYTLFVTFVQFSLSAEFKNSSNSNVDSGISNFSTNKCGGKICLPKCCDNGLSVGKYKACLNNALSASTEFNTIIYDKDLKKTDKLLLDVFALVPNKFSDEEFKTNSADYSRVGGISYLTEDGTLYLEFPNQFTRWYKFNSSNYCVDVRISARPQVKIWTIVKEEQNETKPAHSVGLLISSVFLVMVLFVYSVLPELRNLNGLLLMAYVFSLLGGFVLLATMQLGSTEFSTAECKGLSYATYFFLLASFCWMTIMSLDIWWTFRGQAKARPIHRRGERFKFGIYCAVAFGISLALTIFLMTLDLVDMSAYPWFVTPQVTSLGCFLGGKPMLLYMYCPMFILILSNWVFFLMTVFNMWRLFRNTAMLDTPAMGANVSHRKHKHRFLIYLKLSIIMGINWILEIVSSFKPNSFMWKPTDAFNILIGVVLFLIFVCKKKIFKKLVKRFTVWRDGRRISQYSKTTTTDSECSQEATPFSFNPNPNNTYKAAY